MKLFPNQEYLSNKFPKITYAFVSNYIIKSQIKRKILKDKPTLDMIFVVNDVSEWNKANFQRNKKHYPLISKIFTYRIVNFFQRRGAKFHFNSFIDENGQNIQYGIVDYNDFKDDLIYWDTLVVSTIMQKPYEVIIDNPSVSEYQNKNLLSAMCLSSFLSLKENNESVVLKEQDFFKLILKIPFIHNYFFQIFNKYNFDEVLEDLIEDFREIYLPILDKSQGFIQYKDNEFHITNTVESRRFFLSNVNDEVIRATSKLRYFHEKMEDKLYEKLKLDTKLINEISTNFKIEHIKSIHKAINHILHKQKNSRIFLILMGKWFFFGFLIFKYIIKGLVLYYLYKKSGSLYKNSHIEEKTPENKRL